MEDRTDRLPRFPFPLVQAGTRDADGRWRLVHAFGDGAGAAAAVDPGADAQALLALAAARGLAVRTVFLTQADAVSASALADLVRHGVATLVLHAAAPAASVAAARAAGLEVRAVGDGEGVAVGELPVRVLHVPEAGADACCVLAGVPGGRQALFTGTHLLLSGSGPEGVRLSPAPMPRLRALVGDVHVFPGRAAAHGPWHRPLGAEKVLHPALAPPPATADVAFRPPPSHGQAGTSSAASDRP